MEILSCSFLVCRALSAQWRSVGAVAPERVVASFLCSRLVSCTCALLWMFILTHATALIAVSFKRHIHCTIFNRVMSPTLVCVYVEC